MTYSNHVVFGGTMHHANVADKVRHYSCGSEATHAGGNGRQTKMPACPITGMDDGAKSFDDLTVSCASSLAHAPGTNGGQVLGSALPHGGAGR